MIEAPAHLAHIARDALTSLLDRPGRLALGVAGTAFGLGSLLVTIGFARSSADQVLASFDHQEATTVIASISERPAGGAAGWPAVERASALLGVRAVAGVAPLDGVRIERPGALGEAEPTSLTALAVAGRIPEAVGASVLEGRAFDAASTTPPVVTAVLGARAAATLGLADLANAPAVIVDGKPVPISGILGPARRWPGVDAAVLLPAATRGEPGPTTAIVVTGFGAGTAVSDQIAIAIAPDDPGSVTVQAPPDLAARRREVAGDLNSMAVGLGVMALLAGALQITNATLAEVMVRVSEIGLRQAVGATRTAIAFQFVLEGAATGLLGGMIGASAAIVALIAIAALNGWHPALPGTAVLATPVVGAVIGGVAALLPAVRAARIDPAQALRGMT